MRNTYSEDGDTFWVDLRGKDGDVVERAAISRCGFANVDAINGTWFCVQSRNTKYAIATVKADNGGRTTVYMHRLVTAAQPGEQVDHINHDGLDNRRDNLRAVSQSVNQQNRQGPSKSSTTGALNVSKAHGKFRVELRANGKRQRLGLYATVAEASVAAAQARLARGVN